MFKCEVGTTRVVLVRAYMYLALIVHIERRRLIHTRNFHIVT
jgi:hypothetical protein